MPTIGERSTHDCPDCGQPMYWSEVALRGQHLPTRAAGEVGPTIEYVDAYRCANGHTSQQCPVCGSYATAAWRERENLHYHVICANCGNDSIVNV
jgi:endogenous inhibitor of DNA gyrase (YacG/DUF329 family)